MKREVGRPNTDPAYRLATRAWFNAVSLASGGMTAAELEELFRPKQSSEARASGVRSGLWGKYRDGRVCPKQIPDYKGRTPIVERVEKRFKGTRIWLNMPFWLMLSKSQVSMDTLKEIYLLLPEYLTDLLVAERPPYSRTFWRRPGDMEQVYERLVSVGTLDSITAVLALIKECETTQNQEMHERGLYYWALCANQLRADPVLSTLVDAMNLIIEDRYSRVSYISEYGDYYKLPKGVIRSTLSIK